MPGEIITAGTITISGHRDYPDRAGLFRGLDRLRADTYILGGARGADTDALEYLSRTQPGSNRTVVVPNRVQDQSVLSRESISQNATKVIELKNVGSDRFKIRNRFMVDSSDKLAAFYDGRGSGGTFNTIQYAQSKGVPVEIIQLVEMNEAAVLSLEMDEFNEWLDECGRAKVPQACVKGLAVRGMKRFPKAAWPGMLQKIHRLP